MTRPTAEMRRDVFRRADGRCEYCRIHQEDSASRHQIDHVIAIKHGGDTTFENLALSCLLCNRRKSSDIGAIDPQTGQFVRLFNPRQQLWKDHFLFEGNLLVGRTPEGRATIEFFRLNLPDRLQERNVLIALGRLL